MPTLQIGYCIIFSLLYIVPVFVVSNCLGYILLYTILCLSLFVLLSPFFSWALVTALLLLLRSFVLLFQFFLEFAFCNFSDIWNCVLYCDRSPESVSCHCSARYTFTKCKFVFFYITFLLHLFILTFCDVFIWVYSTVYKLNIGKWFVHTSLNIWISFFLQLLLVVAIMCAAANY